MVIEQRIEKFEAALAELATKLSDAPTAELLLGRIIVLIAGEFSARLDRRLRPLGLTEMEFRVLFALLGRPDGSASPGDLCAHTAQTPANMTRICDGLVSRGLITRDLSAHDRRRMELRLTRKGESLLRRLLPAMFDSVRGSFKNLSRSELQLATQLLRRVAAAVSKQSDLEEPAA
jgi:MarR family transcriptional regulator, negative regulator of the multidrug operon emrRAB